MVPDYPVSAIPRVQLQRQVDRAVRGAMRLRVQRAHAKDFVALTLFPDHRPRHDGREDENCEVTEFE